MPRYDGCTWLNLTDLVEQCDFQTHYQCLGCCYGYKSNRPCTDVHSDDYVVIECSKCFIV